MKKLLFILILTTKLCYGQEIKLLEDILCSPVLHITDVGQGSGIFIRDSSNIFFVTARHNLFAPEITTNNDTIYKLVPTNGQLIFYPHDIMTDNQATINIDLKQAFNSKMIKYNKTQDIAIVAIGYISNLKNISFQSVSYFKFIQKNQSTIVHPIRDYDRKYFETTIGGEVVLFGFPSSIGLVQSPQFDYFRPLLRKGIIAGKYEKNKTIIIDCPSYYGNSGGPVWEIKNSWNRIDFYLIGIVTEFIPYVEHWENKSNKIVNLEMTNSDYSIVTSIDFAIELMKEFK